MKQYCRYCSHAIGLEDDLIYCEVKNKQRRKEKCIRPNKCKDFELNPYDVFDWELKKTYNPRYKEKKKSKGEQIKFE